MKNLTYLFGAALGFCLLSAFSTKNPQPSDANAVIPTDTSTTQATGFTLSPIVDFDAFMTLAAEVQPYRRKHLVSLDTFNSWAQMPGTVILDTRSDSLYNGKHLKGAIHLDFTNFTQESLAALIPNRNTRILIYCNNNFKDFFFEPAFFVSKAIRLPDVQGSGASKAKLNQKPLSLALNIPTFINLYGYGYKNVYELGEQVFVLDGRLKFEGTAVPQ